MHGDITLGFALTGSYCTFSKVIPQIEVLSGLGYDIIPILSENTASTDTRFGTAESHIKRIEEITGHRVIASIPEAEIRTRTESREKTK